MKSRTVNRKGERKMRNRNVVLFAVISVFIASHFLGGFKGSSAAAEEQKEIVILHVADYTGPTSDLLASIADGQIDYFKHNHQLMQCCIMLCALFMLLHCKIDFLSQALA